MSLGTVFISHKHKDKEIAQVVGDFMRDASGNRIDIYLSSNPKFKGTRAGADLSSELDKAILESGIVILVYTGRSGKVDWDYCIYECTFARSHDIRVVILQCVDDAPAPFISTVRTLVADKANIYKFAKDFLTSPDFLKEQKEPVTAFAPEDPVIEEKANAFHKNLNGAIAKHLGKDPVQWSAWPTMRVRFGANSIAKIRKADAEERAKAVREELLGQAEVADSSGADQIFGVGIDSGQLFGSLVASWQESYEDHELDWLHSVCSQIEAFARKRFPVLREARLPEVQGKSSVVPIVTNMLSFPPGGDKEFEIKFYDLQSRSRALTEIMLGRKQIHCEIIEPDGSARLDLRKIYKDMKKRDIYRLPIFDKAWKVLYMVHRSVIADFLLEVDADKPTLQDILAVPELEKTFSATIAFVSEDATVEDARKALAEVPNGRDLFITETGERDAPVLGMVTNTDLERYV